MRQLISRAGLGGALALALFAAAVAGTVTYAYDVQGRLISATYSDGTMICYHYDAAGNRTSYTVVNGTCS
jgi:uncharacterized protein RhaS with RHS repeats